MKSWAELAAERRRVLAEGSRAPSASARGALPDVKRGKPAKQPSMEEVPRQQIEIPSTFGTLGTFDIWHGGGNATRSEVVSPLPGSSLNNAQNAVPGPLPDPADLIERIAILEHAGTPMEDAEVQILDEAGFPSWQAYVDALATRLRCQIEAAQVPTARPLARHWQALALHSLGFLTSPWWPLACRLGWALIDLFGVRLDAPLVRLEDWGLAIAPAFRGLAHTRLVELTCEGA
jgi:hypothetical protein